MGLVPYDCSLHKKMRVSSIALGLLLLVGASAQYDEYDPDYDGGDGGDDFGEGEAGEEDVVVLTAGNFEASTAGYALVRTPI